MILLQQVSYTHPDKELLFSNIDLSVGGQEKVALIGNNGVGKSTLLKILAGELFPFSGTVKVDSKPYYLPQIFGQFDHLTIAQALGIENKLRALKGILDGEVTQNNLDVLDEDWGVEQRCEEALHHWEMEKVGLWQKLGSLSGGQKTRVFLTGISIHNPRCILLDEPSNHLDVAGRALLYGFIQSTNSNLVVVSHDRKLLNLVDTIFEMSTGGIKTYGGNYDFYLEQKESEHKALAHHIEDKEKALRKAKEKQRESRERQQKLDSRGRGKKVKAGVARIMMNTLRNKAENTSSKLQKVHDEKFDGISKDLQDLRSGLPDRDQMKFGFDHSDLHKGKVMFKLSWVNVNFDDKPLWKNSLGFQITSGERIALKGANGSGKTTLINLLLGNLEPDSGELYRSQNKFVYIDQDYSLLDNRLQVYQQAQEFNTNGLLEHEVKIRLTRFLFAQHEWDKSVSVLSGGERMRLLICCLSMAQIAPDIIVLDEPTNNLDLQNLEILTTAIKDYQGTLIVVSHDETFLEQIGVGRVIALD